MQLIGVSRKNLIYRFLAEALLLSSMTVGLGTVLTSMLVFFWLDYSPLMKELFFYPWWMALLAFAGVVAVTVLFGILPILLLLTKTPSAILAKYDI